MQKIRTLYINLDYSEQHICISHKDQNGRRKGNKDKKEYDWRKTNHLSYLAFDTVGNNWLRVSVIEVVFFSMKMCVWLSSHDLWNASKALSLHWVVSQLA